MYNNYFFTVIDKFIYQLEIIKNAFIDKCVVLGDFSLDYEKFMMIIMHTNCYSKILKIPSLCAVLFKLFIL